MSALLATDDNGSELKRLQPGQELTFSLTKDGRVKNLDYDINDYRSLHFSRKSNGYSSQFVEANLERQIAHAYGTVSSSLFLAGRRAGLSDKLIMQMAEIFGWDVDFALDIRRGDRFSVVYDEVYKDGQKLRDGTILAAEFVNQKRVTRAFRHVDSSGSGEYFTSEGLSMRKAFLRSPVPFARVSSRFNLKRKHPVLHKIRAHRGVDYAASRGTPIKASGDGKVSFIGRKGGYGKTIILQHGATYTTLYAHMSRYSKGIKRGARVRQGQTIGFIGSTGLATGPHLHYEFRVRGVHRNPLTVKLPLANPISAKYKAGYLQSAKPLIAQLDILSRTQLAAND